MTTKLVTAPQFLPVTLAEAKAHCRGPEADDDVLITSLIGVATERCEQQLGRSIMRQTRECVIDGFDGSAIRLDWLPVLAIESVTYLSPSTQLSVTLPATEYSSDDLLDVERVSFYVFPAYGKSWPDALDAPNAVRVRYRSGFSDSAIEATQQAAVPKLLKHWILLQISTMYEHREEIAAGVAVNALPGRFVDGLLDRYRILTVGA